MDRSSRLRSGTREITSIFPPRWRTKVRSETPRTVIPGSCWTAAATRSPWASSLQWTVTSRTLQSPSWLMRSIASRPPPASPMALASRANVPGMSVSSTVRVMA
jgi:hypothetical protein